jgi:very-short-patch-repair endonuclease
MNNYGLTKVRDHQRKNPTKFEVVFRSKLRKWKLRFQEQKILFGYIADFYLPQFDLVIEIDGAAHYTYKLESEVV